jgi:hypothetical protein
VRAQRRKSAHRKTRVDGRNGARGEIEQRRLVDRATNVEGRRIEVRELVPR